MTFNDHHTVGVRKDGETNYLHRTHGYPEGFLNAFARAIEDGDSDPAVVFDTLGFALDESNDWCWSTNQVHASDHKVPVWDVALDRVFLTENGTPPAIVDFSRADFVARYKR